jgi:light-regulated signal transduction histidine kinase (bacteriophytochrome)
MTQIYLEETGAALTEGGRKRLDQVIAGADRMDQMIEDLLRFCRVTHGSPGCSRIDLNAIVARLINQLQVSEPARRVELRIAALPDCEGDPGLIEQVLSNLLSNAFKFTRQRADALIEVGTTRAEHEGETEQVYFVRDNGAGFNMKYAQKLFGVFQRLHSQEQFPGTGVGLSIVKRILERHGGRIWAESTPGQGATFFFVVGRAQ